VDIYRSEKKAPVLMTGANPYARCAVEKLPEMYLREFPDSIEKPIHRTYNMTTTRIISGEVLK